MGTLVSQLETKAMYMVGLFNETVERLATAMHSSNALPPITHTMSKVVMVTEAYRNKWGPFDVFNETAHRNVPQIQYYNVSENQPLSAYKEKARQLILTEMSNNGHR